LSGDVADDPVPTSIEEERWSLCEQRVKLVDHLDSVDVNSDKGLSSVVTVQLHVHCCSVGFTEFPTPSVSLGDNRAAFSVADRP
jgi:hypothetical protein